MLVDFGTEQLGGALAEGGVSLATDESLPPDWPRHPQSRAFLTTVGLPREAPLMRFDITGGLARGRLGRQIGAFAFLPSSHRIVLDGTTGRVYVEDDGAHRLLATDLSSLVHLCELVAMLRPDAGRYDRRTVACGPGTVAGMRRTMLELIAETDPVLLDVADDISTFWRAQMVIRTLAWIAPPGDDGLAFDLSGGFLEDAFPAWQILRYEDDALPASLTHAPTRRFLRTHGLVRQAAPGWLTEPVEPWTDSGQGYGTPPRAARMISLGGPVEDAELLLEGDTGRLYGRHADDVLVPLNTDVSALAFTTWALPQIRALDAVHRLTEDDHPTAAATFTELLASVDPFGARAPAEGAGAAERPYDGNIWPSHVGDVVTGAISAPGTLDDRPLRVPYDRPRAESVHGAEGLVTATELPPGLRHGPTRAFLAEVGLPREAPLLRFDLGLAEAGPGGLYRLGSFSYGRGGRPVLLEGDTGRVLTTGYYHREPIRPQELELLASDVSTLSYLTEAVARMRPDTGPYARNRVPCGPHVVAALQEEMLKVVRDCDPRMLQEWPGVSGFWRQQMLVRPLVWIGGPGIDGLVYDLDDEVLDVDLSGDYGRCFGLLKPELPAALSHPATRRHLLETGLADVDTAVIEMEGGTLPTVAELYEREEDPSAQLATEFDYDEEYYPRPEGAEGIVRLGVIGDDGALLLDGATGRVYSRYMDSGDEYPMNVDVSAYNVTVWMIGRVRRLSAEGHFEGEHPELVETFLDALAMVDPVAYPHPDAETQWYFYLGDDQMEHLSG
ncbi:SUKH-4 family immunity protein [Streptomyces sp. NBC_00237]|uniref:SUKH-4 family immunity protein n=1 Tax=Streptomyces sp. NBC_00237 TaxID=2975687 RepID=UPI0022527476|nr:SUKH-4 family immunity protein [Streptomyces sp. NBC_00237]MCX5203108.1 SUKH-4 family immunity protein [Streptomyces sp. NBC_00237]